MVNQFGWHNVIKVLLLATLSACGGAGGGAAVAPPSNNMPRFAYATNYGDNTVSIYTVNAVTGQLRHNGYVAAGTAPRSITVDPAGKFAYVTNDGSGNISTYAINASNGTLTPVGAAVAAGSNPYSVTIDAAGKFAYVANAGSGSISAYTIDAITGVLTQVICSGGSTTCTGSNFTAGSSPVCITLDPSGKFAYVANSVSADVSAYTIDATTGALSSTGAAVPTGGSNLRSISIDPTGRFAYVANDGSGNISAFSINSSTGALTRIDAVPGLGGIENFPAETNPTSVTIAPSGKFAYVANFGSDSISAYAINNTTGALTMIDQNGPISFGGSVWAGSKPTSVTIDPSGQFAYVTNFGSSSISTYSIDAGTGILTALHTVAGRNGNLAMTMTRGTTAITYSPRFAYVANYDSADVSAYSINAETGVLTQIPCGGGTGCNGSNFQTGTNPASVTVEPSGRYAYVANSFNGAGGNSVSGYSINASTGKLTSLGAPVSAGSSPRSVIADPSGKFVYVANYVSDNVSVFSIDNATGALSPLDADAGTAGIQNAISAGNSPNSITIDPAGRFAYVASYFSTAVSAFSVNASTGALTALNYVDPAVSVIGGGSPFHITVDPLGKFVYVANYASNDIAAYSINPSTGVLNALPDVDAGSPGNQLTIPSGTNPRAVTFDPSGKFAYAANWYSNDVSAYTLDDTTGMLTSTGTSVAIPRTAPRAITVGSSGKYAYVTNASDGSVSTYTINAVTGALTSIGTAVAAGTGPHAIATTATIQ